MTKIGQEPPNYPMHARAHGLSYACGVICWLQGGQLARQASIIVQVTSVLFFSCCQVLQTNEQQSMLFWQQQTHRDEPMMALLVLACMGATAYLATSPGKGQIEATQALCTDESFAATQQEHVCSGCWYLSDQVVTNPTPMLHKV